MTDATNIADTSAFDEFQDELKPGTKLLQGQYTIEKYLNSGGFAITYLARDSLDRQVVIKECFPGSFCRRSQAVVQARSRAHQSEYKAIVKLFIQEARGLAKLSHPNIVGVHQVFEDNSTAYMALDLIKGRDLLDTLEDENGILKPSDITIILKKILGAIKYMHDQKVLHRDISPDNILLNEDLEPILIDFGAAREQASKVGKVMSALRVVKDGYSPQEFYVSGSVQGPSSDLYALGASFYHLITGEIPPDSQIRLASAAAREPDPYKPLYGNFKGFDDIFLMAIDKSLQLMPKDRLQSAGEWLAKIDQKDYVQAAPVEDVVSATVAHIMQQPDGAEPELPDAKPEPAPAEPAPQAKAKPAAKPAVNRLDEIANEMASEDAQKKKLLGKLLAGVAVAAALGGAVVYTQTDLLSGILGGADKLSDPEISSSATPSQTPAIAATPESDTDTGNTVVASTPITPEIDTVGEAETPRTQPVETESVQHLEQETDAPSPATEPETLLPEGGDGNVSVAESTVEPEPVEELVSFTPVDFEDSEIGLTEPEITDITEVSLVLPSIQEQKIPAPRLALIAPSEPGAADAVSFELEDSAIPPVFATDIVQSFAAVNLGNNTSLSTGDTAFIIPDIAQQVHRVATVSPMEPASSVADPEISTAPIALSSIIVPVTYLTTDWSAMLPFGSDDSNGVTITRVKPGAEPWVKKDLTIATLNGEPVETLKDITRVLDTLIAENGTAAIPVVIGTADADGVITDHDTNLKLLGTSTLDDGTTFVTVFENDAWKTTVVSVPAQGSKEFVVGDILVANVEAKEKITGQSTLADILNDGFSTGKDSLRFIVDRNGSNWFAIINISQVGGFQKTSLNNTKTGD